MKKFILLILILPVLLNAQIIDTLAIGANTSTIDAGRGNYISGLQLDKGITDSLYFQVSVDGSTYSNLMDGDSALYILRADSSVSQALALDPVIFYAWRYLKVLSYDNVAKSKKAIKHIREKKR